MISRAMSNSGKSALSWSRRAGLWPLVSQEALPRWSRVEVATNLPGLVAVRDSKNPGAPALLLTPAQWRTLTAALRAGV
jgi:hypothetical protein